MLNISQKYLIFLGHERCIWAVLKKMAPTATAV
jgi:hypothetical protein